MSIEQDIKQVKPFDNEAEKAIVNVLYTQAWMNDQLKLILKPFGITPKQYNILRILNGAIEPLSTSEIRIRMIDKMSDITRLIDRMMKKKWVNRSISSVDKRLVDITITPLGKTLLINIKKSGKPMSGILKRLSEDECQILNNLLDKIRD